MGRGAHFTAMHGSGPANFYYQFNDEAQIKITLANHIAKLTEDILWSKTSWFGFFVNTNLKGMKISGLQKMLDAFNSNTINANNFMKIINDIEMKHPGLHSGQHSFESHKIMKGIKIFYHLKTGKQLDHWVNASVMYK